MELATVTVARVKTTITVDEVGRLVLPKPIRDAIGVSGRMALTVEVVGHAAQIAVPETRAVRVTRQGGRLVYAGPLPKAGDSGEAVLQMRERRLRP